MCSPSSAIGRAKYKTIGLNLSLPKKIDPETNKVMNVTASHDVGD